MRSYKFPCHAVALVHIAEGILAAKAVAVHDCFHQTANIEEANFVLKEELDSFLIGTVGGTGAETGGVRFLCALPMQQNKRQNGKIQKTSEKLIKN